ncbi:esterase/lipase family protein [Pseudonocardia saturnea]
MPQFSVSSTLRRIRTLLDRTPEPQPIELPVEWQGRGPVVLVGGFCTSELTLVPLRDNLTRLGYTVTIYTTGAGMGCGRRTVDDLKDVVRACADAAGSPVRLLGYSRGGQFARVVAGDPAMPVHSLVTLGTPFDVYGVSLPLRLQAAGRPGGRGDARRARPVHVGLLLRVVLRTFP